MSSLILLARIRPESRNSPGTETLEHLQALRHSLVLLRSAFRRTGLHLQVVECVRSPAREPDAHTRVALPTNIARREQKVKIQVEPLLGLPVLKDLVVDMEPFFEHYRSVMPYLVNEELAPKQERLQTPEQRERFDDTTKCILCARVRLPALPSGRMTNTSVLPRS